MMRGHRAAKHLLRHGQLRGVEGEQCIWDAFGASKALNLR